MHIKKYTLLLLLFLAVSLRFIKLGFHDFWFDEVASIITTLPGFYFARFSAENTPPGFFLLLRIWTHLVGYNEFIVRLPSLFFNVVSIVFLYKIGKQYFDDAVGKLAAFFMAIAPLHIWYSQETRGYTLHTLLILIAVYLLSLAIEKKDWRIWLAFTITTLIALFVSFISFIAIFATFFLVPKNKNAMLAWFFSISSIIIIFILSWGTVFLNRCLAAKANFWASSFNVSSISIMIDNFNLGYNGNSFTYPLMLALTVALFLRGFLITKLSHAQIKLLSFFAFSVTFAVLLSIIMRVFIVRILLAFSPFYYLFIAKGIKDFSFFWIRILIMAAYTIMTCLALTSYYNNDIADQIHHYGIPAKKPIKPISLYLRNQSEAEDIVIYTTVDIMFPCWYYLRDRFPIAYYFSSSHEDSYWQHVINNNSEVQSRFPYELIFMHSLDDLKDLQYKKVWLVSSSWDRSSKLDTNSIKTMKLMDERYPRLSQKFFDGIIISLYSLEQ
jgi:uncharacterized membrane protein